MSLIPALLLFTEYPPFGYRAGNRLSDCEKKAHRGIHKKNKGIALRFRLSSMEQMEAVQKEKKAEIVQSINKNRSFIGTFVSSVDLLLFF